MDDGSVLPHYLSSHHTESFNSEGFDNYGLRVGEVVAIYPVDHTLNHSKTQTEYQVLIQLRDGNGSPIDTTYHCVTSDQFGTAGDSERFTYRVSTGEVPGALSNGARVLVACPNGETNAAIIIGGIKHGNAPNDLPTAAGNNYTKTFNGVSITINDAGEVSLVVAGATTVDGKPDPNKSNSTNKGSSITILRNGTVAISNGYPNSGETITIDTPNRKIHVNAQDSLTETTASWQLTAGGNVAIQAASASIQATGDAQLSGKRTLIGSSSSKEPLVLGAQLALQIQALVAILASFSTPVNAMGFTTSSTPGSAVTISPVLIQALQSWAATSAKAYLATTKFTER